MRTTGIATVVGLGLAALAASAGPAAAERKTMLTGVLGLGVGAVDDQGDERPADGVMSLGLTVSWEDGPVLYPDRPGYAARAVIVPELHLRRLSVNEQRAGDVHDTTLALSAGLRFELAAAQREMGLLKVSVRAGFFGALHAGLLADDDRTRFIGGGFGEYVWLGHRSRIGVAFDVMRMQGQQVAGAGGVLARVPPWAFDDPRYTVIQGLLSFGAFL